MNVPNLPNDVGFILNKLKENGFEAYIVGGCVRDSIMGIAPHDWDMTTSATPEEVKGIFPHTFDTGIKHGTVTVVLNKENYEITTYRVEGEYEDCRHPSYVSFTRDLDEDLLRRDFTINAIAFNESDVYVDLFGGIEDIGKKVIKGVGFPAERFQEDALRMLRAIRFSCQLNFEIESETLEALKEKSPLIKNISAERIREELTKTFTATYTKNLPILWDSNLLTFIAKDLSVSLKENENKIIRSLNILPKDIVTRYGAVIHYGDEKSVMEFIKFLKFDTKTKKQLEVVVKNIGTNINIDEVSIRKFASLVSIEIASIIFAIKVSKEEVEYEKGLTILNYIKNNGDCLSVKDLDISGDDLFEAGVKKGKGMGATLNFLLSKVLEEPSLNNKLKLLELLK